MNRNLKGSDCNVKKVFPRYILAITSSVTSKMQQQGLQPTGCLISAELPSLLFLLWRVPSRFLDDM